MLQSYFSLRLFHCYLCGFFWVEWKLFTRSVRALLVNSVNHLSTCVCPPKNPHFFLYLCSCITTRPLLWVVSPCQGLHANISQKPDPAEAVSVPVCVLVSEEQFKICGLWEQSRSTVSPTGSLYPCLWHWPSKGWMLSGFQWEEFSSWGSVSGVWLLSWIQHKVFASKGVQYKAS